MTEDKKKKTKDEIIAAKKAKFEKLKAELAVISMKENRQARKDRDTALFTAGACFLAALEGDDAELKKQVADVWVRVSVAHAPIITDHRRKCLNKTAFSKSE